MARRWWALAAVSLATFVSGLDNSVVNVALPTIQRQLGLATSGLEWVVSGYVLVFAGLMLVGGRLADVYGRRRVFRAGLAVFSAASLLAGLSPTGSVLVAARGLQGLGAALLTPAALAILPAAFVSRRERDRAVGLWSAVGALALAVGPVTGGVIAQRWGWNWIFFINVPLGAVAYLVAGYAIPRPATQRGADRGTARARRLDLPGLASSTAALIGLTYALIEGAGRGWSSPVILASLGAAGLGAAVFVVVEAHGGDPMIDLSLFRARGFVGGTLILGLWAFAVFGVYFFTALYLQNTLGLSPTAAGAAFVPLAAVTAVAAMAAGAITQRLGTAGTVCTALAIMAAAMVGVAGVGAHATLGDLMPWLLAYGAGAGLLVPLNSAVLGMLPPARAGAASAVLNAAREVFGLFGVTVLGAILAARQTALTHQGDQPLPAFVAGYQLALITAAVVIAAGIPLSVYALRRPARPRTRSRTEAGTEPVGAGRHTDPTPAPAPVPAA
jgi:EmrB/QacA subfamily drug resistance transporter